MPRPRPAIAKTLIGTSSKHTHHEASGRAFCRNKWHWYTKNTGGTNLSSPANHLKGHLEPIGLISILRFGCPPPPRTWLTFNKHTAPPNSCKPSGIDPLAVLQDLGSVQHELHQELRHQHAGAHHDNTQHLSNLRKPEKKHLNNQVAVFFSVAGAGFWGNVHGN